MTDDEILVGSVDELMAVAAGDQAVAAALAARGRKRVEQWIKEGVIVDAIEASRRRGTPIERVPEEEVVSIISGGRRYFFASALDLPPNAVARVNRVLHVTPAARFLWWRRPHGSLGAKTIAEAIREGRVQRCVELATGYSREHGDASGM